MATTTGRAPKAIQKILIVGDAGVGKTSLMNRYVSAKFSSQYKATIGADFHPKEIQVDDMSVTLQIWDTAGQERFQSLGHRFYRGADACILVYDVTNAASFQKLWTFWRGEFLKRADVAGADFPMVVVGNKCDVEAERHAVTERKAAATCADNGLPHFHVSAKTGHNVDQAFLTVVKAALKRPGPEIDIPDTLTLNVPPATRSGGSDCAC